MPPKPYSWLRDHSLALDAICHVKEIFLLSRRYARTFFREYDLSLKNWQKALDDPEVGWDSTLEKIVSKQKFCESKARIEAYEAAARPYAQAVLDYLGVKVEVIGRENLREGPAILAMAPHFAETDYLAPAAAFAGCQIRYAAKKAMFWFPYVGKAMKMLGMTKLFRKGKNTARDISSMNRTAEMIKLDQLCNNYFLYYGIYINGTRLPGENRVGSHEAGEVKNGAFMQAIYSMMDIIPVGIVGSMDIKRKGSIRVNRGTQDDPKIVYLIVTEPINVKDYISKEDLGDKEKVNAAKVAMREECRLRIIDGMIRLIETKDGGYQKRNNLEGLLHERETIVLKQEIASLKEQIRLKEKEITL